MTTAGELPEVRTERHADTTDVLARLHPVHRAMQLGEASHTFQVARLTANARRVVVHIQIQSRRAEDRHQIAKETVQ